MVWLQNKRIRIAAAMALCVIVAGAFIAFSPAGTCVRDQTAILLSGPYSEVPVRAVSSAQIICQRNNYQPVEILSALRRR